jgi:hypothetical protein
MVQGGYDKQSIDLAIVLRAQSLSCLCSLCVILTFSNPSNDPSIFFYQSIKMRFLLPLSWRFQPCRWPFWTPCSLSITSVHIWPLQSLGAAVQWCFHVECSKHLLFQLVTMRVFDSILGNITFHRMAESCIHEFYNEDRRMTARRFLESVMRTVWLDSSSK